MRKILLAIVIFFLIVSFGYCIEKNSKLYKVSVSKSYYFELSDEKIFDFVSKQENVSFSDSVAVVEEMLGEATVDQVLVSKKGEFRARLLRYYMKIWEKDLVNEAHDMSVSFYFDENNLLEEISSQNVNRVISRRRLKVKKFETR